MWPDFGEISSNNYKDIAFTLFSGSSPALTLDLLNPKSNQHIYEPKYICTKMGLNSHYWFLRHGVPRLSVCSLVDAHTRKQYPSGTEGFRCWRHKRIDNKVIDNYFDSLQPAMLLSTFNILKNTCHLQSQY